MRTQQSIFNAGKQLHQMVGLYKTTRSTIYSTPQAQMAMKALQWYSLDSNEAEVHQWMLYHLYCNIKQVIMVNQLIYHFAFVNSVACLVVSILQIYLSLVFSCCYFTNSVRWNMTCYKQYLLTWFWINIIDEGVHKRKLLDCSHSKISYIFWMWGT